MKESEKKKLTQTLMEIAKNEIHISYKKAESPLEPCRSKIGGRPDVPEDFKWPEYFSIEDGDKKGKNRPLSFMAQINLQETAALDDEELLPKTGMLSFFYELETMKWGYDPEDRGSAKVMYFPETENLLPAEYPEKLGEDLRVSEFEVEFQKHISLPSYEEFQDADNPNWDDWDDYDECCEACGYKQNESGECTKILGYPDLIQAPMQSECESVAGGSGENQAEAKEWLLLFQMDTITEEGCELYFGDIGCIYFWIKKKDLLERNFDNIWLILQC